MKIFCFSFIVYIVLLLTQPCQDMGAVIGNNVAAGDTRFSQNDPRPHNDSSMDECSPFCICSCCSLSVADHTVSIQITAALIVTFNSTIQVEYKNPNTTTYQASIWQPPKA